MNMMVFVSYIDRYNLFGTNNELFEEMMPFDGACWLLLRWTNQESHSINIMDIATKKATLIPASEAPLISRFIIARDATYWTVWFILEQTRTVCIAGQFKNN